MADNITKTHELFHMLRTAPCSYLYLTFHFTGFPRIILPHFKKNCCFTISTLIIVDMIESSQFYDSQKHTGNSQETIDHTMYRINDNQAVVIVDIVVCRRPIHLINCNRIYDKIHQGYLDTVYYVQFVGFIMRRILNVLL